MPTVVLIDLWWIRRVRVAMGEFLRLDVLLSHEHPCNFHLSSLGTQDVEDMAFSTMNSCQKRFSNGGTELEVFGGVTTLNSYLLDLQRHHFSDVKL